ncbi:DUF3144 domain-containing protein [Haliea sp. E17]|uniref:DUF3144 domain-containing protein n=1 Tax=Haliea sp. E17 TaxID=3401576 RepID=UPI003AAF2FE4
MAKSDAELHHECVNRIIALANTMKDEGASTAIVSAALMSASAVYATYVAAGNSGALAPSGVDKVVDAYRGQLVRVQEKRKAEIDAAQSS